MTGVAFEPAGGRRTDWVAVGEQLVAYAVWLGRNRAWGCRNWDNLALGCSAEDLVREVIADLLSGRCDFDPERGELLPYLKKRLRWKLINLYNAAAARNERVRPIAELGRPQPIDQEGAAVARQYLALLRERAKAYMAQRKRKFDLVVLFDAIVEQGEASVDELQARLGLERDQVYYQLRVLRRLAQKLDAEVADGQG